MIPHFNQTAIVIVEVTEKDKSPDIKYVTIGINGGNVTKAEIAEDALNYIKSDGKKEVKEVFLANNESYRTFIEKNLTDYIVDKE